MPALAFNTYPFHDILDSETGRLVSGRDAAGLARRIEEARDGDLPGREAVLGATRARFGSKTVALDMIDQYERLVAARP